MSAATLAAPNAASRFSEVNMSSGSLDEPVAKLGRAIEHYRAIKRDLFGGYDRQTRPVTLERHRDGLEYRVRAGEIEPLPTDLPLILGDAYFNLRAALDYLAYQMHVRHFRGDQRIPPAVAERSAFPVRDRKPAVPTEKWDRIGNLARRERTAIERLQPYQPRGSRLVKGLRVSLSDIAIINNFDKHRKLHVTRSIP